MRISADDHAGLMVAVAEEAPRRGLTFREACMDALLPWLSLTNSGTMELQNESLPTSFAALIAMDVNRKRPRGVVTDEKVRLIRGGFDGSETAGRYCDRLAETTGLTRGTVYHILKNRYRHDPAYVPPNTARKAGATSAS